MSRVEVRPIELPREAGRFVKAWWPIYDGDEHWVPPLISERKQFLDPGRNPYFQHADVQCFIAYRDGKPVGTIAATVDHAMQEQEPGVGFFGFFEFIEERDIARCLLRTASEWLRERGMTTMRGPFNLSPNHEFGLLVDGFDTDPMIANPHNRPYYAELYEAVGLERSKDWYAYWIDWGPPPERIVRIADRFLRRHAEYELVMGDLQRYEEQVAWVYEIYNDAWSDNWGHVHLSRDEFESMAKGLKQLIDERLLWFALRDGEPVAVALTLPDWNQVVKKMNGRVFPIGWWHFLTGRSKIDAIRVWILGVKKDHQHLPLGAPLYTKTWEEGAKMKIRGAEASLIVEDNFRMRGALEKLGGSIYKTYRIYELDLEATSA